MARLHETFEWDDDKAEANRRKHRVAFDDAMRVLADEEADRFHLEFEDARRDYGELRIATYAPDPAARAMLYVIVWTRRGEHDEITRIISARPAGSKDRKFYEQHHP